jgi:predicted ABC-type ATPase
LKDIFILGGPNGAGKTTAANALLPAGLRTREFVNADEIARGLSPFNVEGVAMAAGRIMIDRIRDLVRQGEDFAIETTCSGRQHAVWLADCKRDGWRITLIFLWLASPELAVERVARRVLQGGHSIPPDVIRRRYAGGIRNMQRLYLPLAENASIYDNTDGQLTLVAKRIEGSELVVCDRERWLRTEEIAQ